MAGQFSRVGNGRALTAVLQLFGSSEADQVATWNNGALAAAAAIPASPIITALTKAIPNNAWVVICSITGTNFEIIQVTALLASGGTALTNAASGTARAARVNGDPIFMLSTPAWLALITATTAPTDNSLGSEYGATGYARQACVFGAPTAADPPVSSNTALLTFGPFTAAVAGTVTYASLMDTGGAGAGTNLNQLAWWTLTTAKTPALNDSVTVAIAALTMSCL